MPPDFKPFFLPCDGASGESLFCVYYPAAQSVSRDPGKQDLSVKKAVVFIPPFAEEMNKSRRMFSLQARALADAGVSSLVVDLYGTGDSGGDFSEARWQIWIENIQTSVKWLLEQQYSEISYIGLRLGGLLALDVVNSGVARIKTVVWWQPVLSGEVYLRQSLRLRAAQNMLSSGDRKNESTQILYDRMMAGEVIELAGYDVHPELGLALREKRANSFTIASNISAVQLELIELVSSDEKKSSLANTDLVAQWQATGQTVNAHVLTGDQFWNTREICVNPELIKTTTSMLS
ncbi:MAG: hydrolase 2, exosortase A system-associated [Pseudomonadales bacterium]|nr:hydrolase 2, exosortase A system-associated [Pseudomonadales bacterium]